jgi:hypothetical protein
MRSKEKGKKGEEKEVITAMLSFFMNDTSPISISLTPSKYKCIKL